MTKQKHRWQHFCTKPRLSLAVLAIFKDGLWVGFFMQGVKMEKWILQSVSHLFEALLGSLPLLMVTVGLGGAGGPPAVVGGGPLPVTRPFGLP